MDITEIIKLGPGAVVSACLLGILWWAGSRFTRSIDNLTARVEEAVDCNTAVLLGLQSQLLTHDLTVSGLNPSTGATVDERTNRAYLKYEEVRRQFDTARELILARHRSGGGGMPPIGGGVLR